MFYVCYMGSKGVVGEFRRHFKSFRGFSVGFKDVTWAFAGFRKVSGPLHGLRGGFGGIFKVYQEASEAEGLRYVTSGPTGF